MIRIIFISILFVCVPLLITAQRNPSANHNNKQRQEFSSKKVSSLVYKPTKITTDNDRETNTYDNSGNTLCKTYEEYKNGSWLNIYKYLYTYNKSNNEITSYYYKWNNDTWEYSSRSASAYDNAGNLITKTYEHWMDNTWVFYGRETQTYDNSGNRLTNLFEQWENNTWGNIFRDTFTYDNTGNQLTSIYQQWENGGWTNYERKTYSYFPSGKRKSYLLEKWKDGAWVNIVRDTHTYSILEDTTLTESWRNEAWVNSSIRIINYDNSGNWLNSLSQLWRNGAWINEGRRLSTYDNEGHNILDVFQVWEDEVWKDRWKYSTTYDVSGNKLSQIKEEFLNGALYRTEKLFYVYNSDGNSIHGESLFLQDGIWVPLGSLIFLYYKGLDFENYVDAKYYDAAYQTFYDTTSAELNPLILFQNYPNPFNSSTVINYLVPEDGQVQLNIYDILGSKVATLANEYKPAGSYSVKFDGSNFSSGIYLYRLEHKTYSTSKKFIIIK